LALSDYGQFYVSIDGSLLGEATSVETELEGDDQDAFTLAKGFAGQTISPRKRVTTVENMVPSSGFEFDFEKAQRDGTIHTLGLVSDSGKKMVAKGYIRGVKVSAGVGKSAMVSFAHHAEPSIFQ
jgi:hypothetical protein